MTPEQIAKGLKDSPRLALLAMVDGEAWCDIIERTPRNAKGQRRSYRWALGPLEARGLITVRNHPLNASNRHWKPATCHFTLEGLAVRAILEEARND